jgi:hypothetical protein
MATGLSAGQQHIYFTDLWDQASSGVSGPTVPGWENEAHDVNFDVMTTDLLHFFAPDMGQPGGGAVL